ncbi:MAG TPA: molybdopterin cofactor-binding domain-containing protein, partial [Xanthobacteraceae bacterium]|nr:molybdopterin cofactor-binding domain-containing protein [Xanthobacteraceae bacterium]
MTIHASRRDVLKGGGALVVSFSFAAAIGEALAQGTKPLALTEVDSFLAIDAGGEVTLYSGKVDLGTGVATALPQIVADELDVPLNRIKLIQGDTMLTPDQGPTWGSLSVQIGGMQLRNAAATAKAALLEQAAKRLDAKKEELKVADELDVPLNRIKLVQGDTALTPDQGTTWGSLSIQIGGMQLRNAAATAKAALLEQAAK